ncbi:MAG: patatin-like phospholipase family protein [Saprospiraceae bacterium]
MKIGISLSGGGAKGIAHVGVLQALRDHDIEVDLIAATSAGAIVGALYAAGVEANEMMNVIRNTSYFRIFGLGWPNRGLGDMKYLKEILSTMIKSDSFKSLNKPLFISVMNLNTGLVEIKKDGSLFDAVCASSSVPILFKPVVMDGMHYLDGGIGMNMPVRCLIGKCDIIIGVNLVNHHPISDKYLSSWKEIISRVFDLSVYNNVKPELDLCDFVIEPLEMQKYSRFIFSQPEELYKAGYEGALKQIPKLTEKIKRMQRFTE